VTISRHGGAPGITPGASLSEFAPAKINLTLRVRGRRADGYHDIESLVVFASLGDRLALTPSDTLGLALRGPNAGTLAAEDPGAGDNLVVRAARALAERVDGLKLGHFILDKRLPVAAGIGGGSTDAAAALRLLARRNGLAPEDARLFDAARATGADVPVCLDPRPRLMRGIGEILSEPLALPPLPAVLVNPGVAIATRDVFGKLGLSPGEMQPAETDVSIPGRRDALVDHIARRANDLEPAAVALQPVVRTVLDALRRCDGCRLARMSGSGATCFALFPSQRAAATAVRSLRASHPAWWVRATTLG